MTVGVRHVPVETTNVRMRFFPSYADAVWLVRFTAIQRSPLPTPSGKPGKFEAAGGGGGSVGA